MTHEVMRSLVRDMGNVRCPQCVNVQGEYTIENVLEQLRRVPKPGDSSLMTHSAFRGFKAAFHHSKPRIACRCFHFEGEKNSENLREELVLPGWSFQSQEMASSSNKKLPQPEEGSGLEAQTSSDELRRVQVSAKSSWFENSEGHEGHKRHEGHEGQHGKACNVKTYALRKFFTFVCFVT